MPLYADVCYNHRGEGHMMSDKIDAKNVLPQGAVGLRL